MKNLTSIILLFYFLASCNSKVGEAGRYENIKSQGKRFVQPVSNRIMVDKAYLGMSIKELKEAYKGAIFEEKPVHEYGVDGEGLGVKVNENEQPLFYVWTLDGENKIHGITVLSPKIIIDSSLHVGKTAKEFFAINPDATLEIHMLDERFEVGYVKDNRYSVEFLTTDSTRVGNYKYGEGQPQFIGLKRPDARIDRISIDNRN